jgi:hypothetical protein
MGEQEEYLVQLFFSVSNWNVECHTIALIAMTVAIVLVPRYRQCPIHSTRNALTPVETQVMIQKKPPKNTCININSLRPAKTRVLGWP